MPGKVTKKGDTIYLNIGQRWFQYNERSMLGSGAMGTVYKGYDCNSGEPVAIKRVIDRYANNPEIRRRAHLEAELMFRHPNLVEMIGCCEVSPNRGPIFIVSNFVQGENIDQFINTHVRSLPNVEKRICELFFPVLDALSYIHQKGIIHMDIKPSNIMMEQGKNVRLMDLGIADVTDTVNSATSGMMGTPKYAAPEQFSDANRESQLTAATDIYEAGVTLYELLTMSNPFSATTVVEAKELHRELILEKKPMLSDAVYQVIRKATAIYPSDRYQNANQMKMALKAALAAPESKVNWMLWLVAGIVGLFAVVLLLLFLL